MKPKSKVPLYQINLEVKSTTQRLPTHPDPDPSKFNDSSVLLDQTSKSSSQGGVHIPNTVVKQALTSSDSQKKEKSNFMKIIGGQPKLLGSPEKEVPCVSIEIQS